MIDTKRPLPRRVSLAPSQGTRQFAFVDLIHQSTFYTFTRIYSRMPKATREIPSSVYLLLLIPIILFIIFLHFSLLTPGVDAGLHMYGSFLITKGLLPYEHLWNNKPPLIYLIGTLGFIYRPNPFLGVRLLEISLYIFNLAMIYKIAKTAKLVSPAIYPFTFSIIYLLCWDQGFLTETFTIPLNLIVVYLFIRKQRYFEFIVAFLFVTAILLKQNAFVIIAGVIGLDILTNYRTNNIIQKVSRYLLAHFIYVGLVVVLFKWLGIWPDFIDQVFIYNSKYAQHPGLLEAIVNHLKKNSFLSIKGISLVMLFNICLIISLWNYRKAKKEGKLQTGDWFIINAIIIYLLSYIIVYISGKTYPHYFLLLIVPATYIMGHYVKETVVGKIAVFALLLFGVVVNCKTIPFSAVVENNTTELAAYIKNHSSQKDYILMAGFGFQYVHIMANRVSPTRFVMPLSESHGYTEEYKRMLLSDLNTHPPVFVILNKNNYKNLDPESFYTQTIDSLLKSYQTSFENDQFIVFKRI